MKRIYFLVVAAVVLYSGCDNSQNSDQNSNSNKAQEGTASELRANSNAEKDDSATVVSIFNEALENGRAYNWLHYLTTQIGGRLSGSKNAESAVDWSKQVMDSLELTRVWKQDIMVPHWVRGEKEVGNAIYGFEKQPFNVCALGGSVPTSEYGLTAPIVEIQYFNELEKLGRENIEGKIIFFNRKMDSRFANTFYAYSNCVEQRWAGASKAAEYGAVGALIRSLTLSIDDFPHTGSMGYVDSLPKIPAMSISTRGAEQLSRLLTEHKDLEFYMKQSCETLEDAPSHNVIGEIKGSEFPDEIIIVGGHLDSWDTGDGAHDDGAGCVQSIEVLRIFKALGIQPKRTIRAVMFMNEENGLVGGKEYARIAEENGEKHIAAIETDRGGFAPQYFSFQGDESDKEKLLPYVEYLKQYGVSDFKEGGAGADISPLKDHGTLLIGLVPESQRYFDFHHCAQDNIDGVNKRELHLGAAAMASLIYFISENGR